MKLGKIPIKLYGGVDMLFDELVKQCQSERAKRGSQYEKYNGKGPLAASGKIAEKHMASISMLKNIAEIHLHKEYRFVIVGMNAGKDPETGKGKILYCLFDLLEDDITKGDIPSYWTVKEAKEEISRLYEEMPAGETSVEEEVPVEEEPTEKTNTKSRRK